MKLHRKNFTAQREFKPGLNGFLFSIREGKEVVAVAKSFEHAKIFAQTLERYEILRRLDEDEEPLLTLILDLVGHIKQRKRRSRR